MENDSTAFSVVIKKKEENIIALANATFIPPASPANRKTLGVLTVNGTMKICSAIMNYE